MDQALLDEKKQQLEKEREQVQKELDTVSSPDTGDHVPGQRAPKFPDYGDDALDDNTESPTEVEDYVVNVDVTGTLESKMKQIDDALKRIEEGTYGTCEKCEKDIQEKRLDADPSVTVCITCAKSHTS